MPIALVTNYLPPYRLPLYRLLHERYGVEVHCFGGEAHYVPGVAARPRPADRGGAVSRRTGSTASATRRALAEHNDAVIAALAGPRRASRRLARRAAGEDARSCCGPRSGGTR